MSQSECNQFDVTDLAYLRRFVHETSQEAFGALVKRRVDLVYSAALRQTNDGALAEDVTQLVFTALARKAPSLVNRDIVLSAWLLRAVRLSALHILRGERRRRQHERRSATMNANTHNSPPDDQTWEDVRPLLDIAIAALGETDRRAILLRFFEGQSLRDVGTVLGVSEEAARQRIWRAINRLRTLLQARGAAVASIGLATLLSTHAVHAAPITLSELSTRTALASTTIKAGFPLGLKGAIQLMAWTKAQLAGAAALAIILVAGSIATVFHVNHSPPEQKVVLLSRPANGWPNPGPGQPVVATPMTPDARERFNRAYPLAPGQILKRVQLPYIPERAQYFADIDRQHMFDTNDDRRLYCFEWSGKQVEFRRSNTSISTLGLVIHDLLDVPTYKLEISASDRNRALPGDWVMEKGSLLSDQFAGLSKVLQDDFQLPLRFEKREGLRPVIVVSGTFAYKPLITEGPSQKQPFLHLYIGKSPRRSNGMAIGDSRALLRGIGESLGREVTEDTATSPSTIPSTLLWSNHLPGSLTEEQISEVCMHLAQQTGLTFKSEERIVPYWAAIAP
jgi:RNA polymerase sigma factor (sigma-70 family)